MKIPILRHTQNSFALAIEAHFGKGGEHAKKFYKRWWQGNWKNLASWVEPQAVSLVESIGEIVDQELPPWVREKHEESTTKFLLRLQDGLETESVLIPMDAGITLCVSSQIGCRMGCTFCETGRMGLIRHLRTEEIVAQAFFATQKLGKKVRNIVFMGMGEPLDNFDEVMQAIRVLTDPAGGGWGPSRITISTSGHVEGIYRLIQEADPALNLAVSVNAPNDQIRKKIMPVTRRWNMEKLKEAMLKYCLHPRREVFIEYVLLDGINSSLEAAEELAAYLEGLRVRVNLIPYNPQGVLLRETKSFSPPSSEVVENFIGYLRKKNLRVLVRQPKGQDIMAACGQLGNSQIRQSKLQILSQLPSSKNK